jgi:hypothetical protein
MDGGGSAPCPMVGSCMTSIKLRVLLPFSKFFYTKTQKETWETFQHAEILWTLYKIKINNISRN